MLCKHCAHASLRSPLKDVIKHADSAIVSYSDISGSKACVKSTSVAAGMDPKSITSFDPTVVSGYQADVSPTAER
jgi:hypothetical protein